MLMQRAMRLFRVAVVDTAGYARYLGHQFPGRSHNGGLAGSSQTFRMQVQGFTGQG